MDFRTNQGQPRVLVRDQVNASHKRPQNAMPGKSGENRPTTANWTVRFHPCILIFRILQNILFFLIFENIFLKIFLENFRSKLALWCELLIM